MTGFVGGTGKKKGVFVQRFSKSDSIDPIRFRAVSRAI